jgi:type I restriction-modification system DNA methylase subunit
MKNLVKQTLERDFDLPQYTDFVKNLFNEIRIQPQEIKVPDSFKEFIKKITFLSDFSDTQRKTIDIYAVELASGTKVERARSFQRNLISKLLKDNTKDAGLVAFYSKDNPDWRLSFIKLDYKLTDKGVKVEVGTPPKRYSFLVGEAEPSHTAQKQLLPILEDHKNNPLLLDLEEAFSVERVTKEFYERYRKLFEDLSKDLKKNRAFQIIAGKENIDIDNFAKKLLGQIVFLYFLQKKGWLGVPQDKSWGRGDKFFLRTLFDKAKSQKKDFYNEYLEILFYDTLNNPRRDEVDPAYSRYFGCKIPFLNGGLFEPDYDWKNTFVSLGNDIFEEIINTFDLYNFTVKEDEPLEKEVAVDPEMLGKVFENLLSENMRKGQGTYYTPREIVHYMCQESLINHLNTETKLDAERIRKLVAFKDEDLVNGNGSHKKALGFSDDEAQSLDRTLANIKVCDPACGSGAFLVGMLNEIVSARRILEPRSEYKLKKETIQECIYGVDIDPGAVDIAKLRLWLSLVVDFELRDIEPLPNLDYKIMCGNSLLEELIVGDESIKLFDERLLNLKELKSNPSQDARQVELKKQLQEKQKELRDLYDANKLSVAKKKELDTQIMVINKKLNPKVKKAKSEIYHPVFFAEQADEYFKQLRDLHKQFFTEYDPVKKKERRKQIEEIELEFIRSSVKEKVDELDSKIKNLNMQDPGDRKKQAVLIKKKFEYSTIPKQIRDSKIRPYFLWKLNFFEVFQEKGGFDVVIANPPYVDSETMTKANDNLRNNYVGLFKSAKGNWDLFVIFIEKGLQLLRELGIITYIVPNKLIAAKYSEDLRNILVTKNIKELRDYSRVGVFKDVNVYPIVFSIQNNKQKHDVAVTVMKSINEISDSKKIPSAIFYQDIYWDRYFTSKEVLEIIIKISKFLPLDSYLVDISAAATVNEAYKIKEKVKDRSVAGNKFTKKLINTGTIDKYLSLWGKQKTQYINGSYLMPIISDDDLRSISANRYNQAKSGKIIVAGMAKELECFYDEGQYLAGKSTTIILENGNNKIGLKVILSILNSKLISFWFTSYFKSLAMAGGYLSVSHALIRKIPIPQISNGQEKQLIDIVGKILDTTEGENYLKDKEKQAEVKICEHQIDQMVYKLYGLTPDEVKIVEGCNHGK